MNTLPVRQVDWMVWVMYWGTPERIMRLVNMKVEIAADMEQWKTEGFPEDDDPDWITNKLIEIRQEMGKYPLPDHLHWMGPYDGMLNYPKYPRPSVARVFDGSSGEEIVDGG